MFMFKYNYIKQKLHQVIEVLVTWEWDIRNRLKNSSFYLLWPIIKEWLSEEYENKLNDIIIKIIKYHYIYKWEWKIDRTMRRIKNKTWIKIAEEIFNLYTDINSEYILYLEKK